MTNYFQRSWLISISVTAVLLAAFWLVNTSLAQEPFEANSIEATVSGNLQYQGLSLIHI